MQTPTHYSLQHKEGDMKKNEAQNYYEAAVSDLHKYCEKETDLAAVILDEEYPFRVQFLPDPQQTVFGDDNVSEDGEINDLTVTIGLTTTVKSTLKLRMDSKQLKKLIKLAEALGHLYYQAFREEAGDIRGKDDEELKEKIRAALGEPDTED
jgi:hypothetical protein